MMTARHLALTLLAAGSAVGCIGLLYRGPPGELFTDSGLAETAAVLAVWLLLWAVALRFAMPFCRALGGAIMHDDAPHCSLLLIGIMLAVATGYVALALTPSHYGGWLQQLGVTEPPLLFHSWADRTDEYAVLTPLFQTAVRGGLAAYNQFSPYHEALKGFWALPIADWSLIFKPQLWGFWILPPAYAYSLYFAVMWTSMLAGFTILLVQIGAEMRIAALGAMCLLFSGFVQVWWTTNAPAFAMAPWPFVVFLLPLRAWLKLPLLFWVAAVWIFGFVYPPFIISGAFALGLLILAFRREALSLANCAVGACAAAALCICFLIYFGDLIVVMQNTVYPGSRVSQGGGVEFLKLIALFLPFFQTMNLVPLYNVGPSAVQVVSTMLPLTLIFLVNVRSLWEVLERQPLAWTLVGAGLLMMLAWTFLPVPSVLGRVLLWTYVPPNRMLWGVGLLMTLALTLLASKCRFEVSPLRISLFAGTLMASWLISKIGFTSIWNSTDIPPAVALMQSTDEWMATLAVVVTGGLAMRYKASGMALRRMFLSAAAYTGLFTFGTFNPLQQAFPIFDIPYTKFLEEARREAARSPNGWAVLVGGGGAQLSGAGIPAINHVMVAPQLAFFRKFFPGMPDDAFNTIFNRYAYIIPLETINEPRLAQDDMIFVPAAVFRGRPPSRAVDGR